MSGVEEVLAALIRQAQAEAWDAGYVAGGCDSRIVEGDPERNPFLAGDA